MKYLDLLTATVRDDPPEDLTYQRYLCYPLKHQFQHRDTEGYAGFNI